MPDEIFTMSPKLKIIDSKYEEENNALFDQGVTNLKDNNKRRKWYKISSKVSKKLSKELFSDFSPKEVLPRESQIQFDLFNIDNKIVQKMEKLGYP